MPSIILKLTKPVDNGTDELVTSIEFREPTGLDMNVIGNPVDVDFTTGKFKANENMGAMIAHLSGHPPSTIGRISASDWASATLILLPFFLPTPEALSLPATNSRKSTVSTRASSSRKRSRK